MLCCAPPWMVLCLHIMIKYIILNYYFISETMSGRHYTLLCSSLVLVICLHICEARAHPDNNGRVEREERDEYQLSNFPQTLSRGKRGDSFIQ